ncbi:MAG: hypothetical protein NW201_06555 [Gemmatimonadales bacterium]|nr:hypothetical protein [Gemmatimonadales bacterium]
MTDTSRRFFRPAAGFVLLSLLIAGWTAACGTTPVGPPIGGDTPTSVSASSVSRQTVTAGQAVAVRPAVIVRDAGGRALSGVAVRFVAPVGNGTVTDGDARTNAEGIAVVGSWTVSMLPGPDTLAAVVGNLSPVLFIADVTGRPAGAPAVVEAVAGQTPLQVVIVGRDVPVLPRVLVKDTAGIPVPEVRVDWIVSADSSNGVVPVPFSVTTGDGTASVPIWRAARRPGRDTLVARVGTLPDVRFIITATAGFPATMVAAAGADSQRANVGATVPVAPAVVIRDSLGNGVPGLPVQFAVALGAGTVTPAAPASVLTDTAGRAVVTSWRLGSAAGANTLTATINLSLTGLPPAVTLRATAVELVAPAEGNAQTAPILSQLPTAPAVRVRDENGNPVANVPVQFRILSGNGRMVGDSNRVTDANGIARLDGWRLGPVRGEQRLRAQPQGRDAFVFTATATSTDLSALVSASGPTIAVGGAFFDAVPRDTGFTCALTAPAGALRCWGSNRFGQLGVGAADSFRVVPTAPASDPGFRTISAGGAYACGLTPSDALFCWGRPTTQNSGNVFGDASFTSIVTQPTRVQGSRTYRAISLGASHACGIASGADSTLWCWGENDEGEIGDGTTGGQRNAPTLVAGGRKWRSVSVGTSFTCAIDNLPSAWCWGNGTLGRLGTGSVTNVNAPTAVAVGPGLQFAAVSAGEQHACGLLTTGRLQCWGNNASGQLGIGVADTFRVAPGDLSQDASWIAVSAGGAHSCGITSQGQRACWGSDFRGITGLGRVNTQPPTTQPSVLNTELATLGAFVGVVARWDHTCVLGTSGLVACFGMNDLGQLGEPNFAPPIIPAGSAQASTPVRPVVP